MDKNTKPQTVKELLQWAALFLGKESYIEAELLLALVTDFSRAKILTYPDQELTLEIIERFQGLVKERSLGQPLQYLLGKQNFMGLDFLVNKNVLIPRSDTEVLVEEALELAKEQNFPYKILDLCTGSGAIAISLAKYLPQAKLIAVDISLGAIETAKNNARINNVNQQIDFLQGDLFQPVEIAIFDMIVSNPPYITTTEMSELPLDVQKEPALALWGGEDGLDFYRRIIKDSCQYLKPGGWLLVEIGWKQGEQVRGLFERHGFRSCEVKKDWSGNDRVVKGRREKGEWSERARKMEN